MNKTKLDTLLKEGKISLKDYEKGIDILNGKIVENLSEIKLIDKDSKLDQMKNINKMTLEEVNKEQLLTLMNIQTQLKDVHSIKKNVQFFTWLIIINIILGIIFGLITLGNN